ncbi:cupin-like domain-containing protein [Cellvibrio sp. UBA7661]|uniref:cupin-like domain-containing protein n=1 Tax=Cellvibrio sp. UBA7661 TaxID=1946311 RepID=UPI002F3596D2
MLESMQSIKVLEGISPDAIPSTVLESSVPLVLKGLLKTWPIVRAAEQSSLDGFEYLCQFYNGELVNTAIGDANNTGAIFYNQDYSGFSYERARSSLTNVYNNIKNLHASGSQRAYYVDSAPVDFCVPGFREQNDLNLGEFKPRVSLWMGNKTIVSAHHDIPDNIACVVIGKRRFVLFPPGQLENLYIGPLDFNPAGPAISMVDLHNPDFEKFPRYREALAHAQIAELESGDAIYIPSMWWHHVEGLMPFNIMVNYWWTSFPGYIGSPQDAFTHALMNIRSLPADERQHWKNLFDYYIFNASEETVAHIPKEKLGILGDMDEMTVRRLRSQLLNRLNR